MRQSCSQPRRNLENRKIRLHKGFGRICRPGKVLPVPFRGQVAFGPEGVHGVQWVLVRFERGESVDRLSPGVWEEAAVDSRSRDTTT